MMKILFCPPDTPLMVKSRKLLSLKGTFKPTVKAARVYSIRTRIAIFRDANLMVSFRFRSLFSAAVNKMISHPISENKVVVIAVQVAANLPTDPDITFSSEIVIFDVEKPYGLS